MIHRNLHFDTEYRKRAQKIDMNNKFIYPLKLKIKMCLQFKICTLIKSHNLRAHNILERKFIKRPRCTTKLHVWETT
jgi:hypothetical protein